MNNPHKNARMTPLGRAEMVRRILFIRRDGLKVFVAKRSTEGHDDEQPTQECANDAARSSGDGEADRR